jgi:YfiH family protein
MTSPGAGWDAALATQSILTPDWPAPAGVRAAMTLRTGGVSAAPYDSLNLGAHVGDDALAVAENRRRVRESLRLPAEPAWLEQVHGSAVLSLDAIAASPLPADVTPTRSDSATAHRADAAVTRRAGPVCVIQVADCMPVLFASRDGTAIGAAHAGWRGLANGVLEATITAMAQSPEDLVAWLGPAISQPHFEVGNEVRESFIAHDPAAAAAFQPNSRNRWQCDLYTLARQRLTARGLRHISGGTHCTYAEKDRFFSYRRDGRCGRMAALIWLCPS